ncbi:MAG: DUF3261 domain-containing protein [Desulfomicrobium sp.]
MKWLTTLVLLTSLGCAGTANQQRLSEPPNFSQALDLSQYPCPARNGLLLRHSVRLRIPGRNVDQTFSGVMRFEHDGRTIRLVGMAGFGMKLFDLSISQDTVETHFISPGLSRINKLPEHIAFCVRKIWLTPQPKIKNGLSGVENTAFIYGLHNGQRIEHEYASETLASVRALGPREYWNIQYEKPEKDTREPSRIIFNDGQGRYSLDVSLIEQRTTSS